MVVVERDGIGHYRSVVSTLIGGSSPFFPKSVLWKLGAANTQEGFTTHITLSTRRRAPEVLEMFWKDPS